MNRKHFFSLLATYLLVGGVSIGKIDVGRTAPLPLQVGYTDVPFSYDLSFEICKRIDCVKLDCKYDDEKKWNTRGNKKTVFLRETSMRIYYPTDHDESFKPDDSKDRGICKSDGLDHGKFRFICDLDTQRVTASPDVEVSSRQSAAYPVVLFSSGNGAVPHMYTTIIQNMVREGFVIVAISHPCIDVIVHVNGTDFLERQKELGLYQRVLLEVSDARAALDKLVELNGDESGRFYNRLDHEDGLGYMGHSLGGATSMLTAIEESKNGENRVQAVLNMDGRFTFGGRNFAEELRTPLMIMGSPFVWHTQIYPHGWNAWKESIAEGSVAFYVDKSGHYSFSDICHSDKMTWFEKVVMMNCGSILQGGAILPGEMDSIILEYASAFFQLHLKTNQTSRNTLQQRNVRFGAHFYK